AIYQTEAWTKRPATMKEDQVFFTKKGPDLYVIYTAWQSTLEISDIARPAGVSLLGSDQKVKFKVSKGKVLLSAPQISPANTPCDYAWVYKLEGVFE
ncbi:MAG: alpha-L-fucosidase C-terminal domain-containing protein, partial [Bacteroidota bacterium]